MAETLNADQFDERRKSLRRRSFGGGYVEASVDELLADIDVTFSNLAEHERQAVFTADTNAETIDQQRTRLEQLEQRLAGVGDDKAARMQIAKLRAQARAEVERMIGDAETRGAQIVEDARSRAAQILADGREALPMRGEGDPHDDELPVKPTELSDRVGDALAWARYYAALRGVAQAGAQGVLEKLRGARGELDMAERELLELVADAER